MRRRELIVLLGAAAIAAPLTARAQRQAMPVIGLLVSGRGTRPNFGLGLGEAGYDEGRNVVFDYRIMAGQYDQLPAMAADLVSRKVALIAAFDAAAALAAKRATSTIPILFLSGGPVAEGLVASLARPGGNLTGVSLMDVELMPKRLELLSELVPKAKVFALLVNPTAPATEAVVRHTEDAAHARGAELHVLNANSYHDVDVAFAALDRLHIGALLVQPDQLFDGWNSYLPAIAGRHGVAAMYGNSVFAWAGGLISYGPSPSVAQRQMGMYAGRILNGAKPADLPVLQPEKFELVINLKAATALGLTVPPLLMTLADTVIE